MSVAAYIAHELRTPLATQRALLELALTDSNTDIAAWREIGEDVLGACKQQQRVLDAFLSLARSEAGLQRSEPVDLAAIAREVLVAHDVRDLEHVDALEPARTSGDPGLIESLVANLVSNAIRHNAPQGRIDVASFTAEGRAVFRVANTGPVIPGDVDRLFKPFQRIGSGGVGLGLTIVQEIADAHDATVITRVRPTGGLAVDVAFIAYV
jgi:signal transduction histidine kinase